MCFRNARAALTIRAWQSNEQVPIWHGVRMRRTGAAPTPMRRRAR